MPEASRTLSGDPRAAIPADDHGCNPCAGAADFGQGLCRDGPVVPRTVTVIADGPSAMPICYILFRVLDRRGAPIWNLSRPAANGTTAFSLPPRCSVRQERPGPMISPLRELRPMLS